MATRIQLRRGTATEWSLANPVLSNGEPGIETDTGILKLGNGTDVWSVLPIAFSNLFPSLAPGSNKISRNSLPISGLMALKRSLETGVRNTGIQVLGDSTGNDSFDWPYRFAQSLAALYPAYTVQSRLWSDTTQQYSAATTIQTGPLGVQYVDALADVGKNALLSPGVHPSSGNLDLRARVSMANWTTNPVLGTLHSRASGVAGNYSYWLNYTTAKRLQFVYSVDGSTFLTVLSTVSVPFTDSQTGWVRAVVIPNNGSQAEFRFYTSTDGNTWTQLGTTVTATSFTLFGGNANFEFGGRGSGSFAGKIYELEYRDGENGPLMAPALPGQYNPNPLSQPDMVVVGSPTLTLVNGSRAGGTLAYLSDSVRLPKLIPNYSQAVTFVNGGHNEGTSVGQEFLTAFRSLLAAIRARRSGPIVAVTQNPQVLAAGVINSQLYRRLDILGLVDECSVIDTYQAFLNYGSSWSTELMADAVHPNAAGANVWRDAVMSHFLAT